MCGIAGIVYDNQPREVAMAAVRQMIASQRHRGPDGEGFYDAARVSLGHCRLAIIDLSDGGHQPMSDPEGRCWITFNGEIYNYLELAKELRACGYRFRGQSDTEVLLAAYRQWGDGCLDRLRGMFAFAIWDSSEGCLFAARDRLGIKPFHYLSNGNWQLAFSSELKALLALLPQRRVNISLAREFLAWNLLDHEPAETMVAGIQRLPAAHSLTWRPGRGITLRQYWRLEVSDQVTTAPEQKKNLTAEFRGRLQDSIAVHLRSDVPVGTSLSGGLDSSSIVCLVRTELLKRRAWQDNWQHTFSACFEDPRIDERPYIEAIAAATSCQTHYVFPSGERLRDEMDAWLWHQEEPVGSTSPYAYYCVARLAKEYGIKVLLDGQGADEQLAGYRKFILIYLRQLIVSGHYARAVREALAFSCSPEILRTIRLVDGRRYLLRSCHEVDQLWSGESKPVRPFAMLLGDSLGRRLQVDMTHFSLPVLLRYEDRNTMAFGVESRVPFVDHILVEWLATLPADMRLSNGWTKRILRDALADVLPARVLWRKSKLGYSTPEGDWVRGPLAAWQNETLSAPEYLKEVVDSSGLKQIVARRTAGDCSLALKNILFRLALYESWARRFLR